MEAFRKYWIPDASEDYGWKANIDSKSKIIMLKIKSISDVRWFCNKDIRGGWIEPIPPQLPSDDCATVNMEMYITAESIQWKYIEYLTETLQLMPPSPLFDLFLHELLSSPHAILMFQNSELSFFVAEIEQKLNRNEKHNDE